MSGLAGIFIKYIYAGCGTSLKSYSTPVYRKFENIQMLVPSDYDMVLKGLYGSDYMQLPPKEKRWNQAPMYIGFSDGSAVDFQNNG